MGRGFLNRDNRYHRLVSSGKGSEVEVKAVESGSGESVDDRDIRHDGVSRVGSARWWVHDL